MRIRALALTLLMTGCPTAPPLPDDAGVSVIDSGVEPVDAGGARDAGTDAGTDAGIDAGVTSDAGIDASIPSDAGFDGGVIPEEDGGLDGPPCPTTTNAGPLGIAGLLIQNDGRFSVGGLPFVVVHYTTGWTGIASTASALTLDAGYPLVSRDAFEVRGTFQPATTTAPFSLREVLARGDGGVDVTWSVAHPTGVGTESLVASIDIPIKVGAERLVTWSGASPGSLRLPVEYSAAVGANLTNLISGVTRLTLPATRGDVVIEGTGLTFSLHDVRAYFAPTYTVRLYFSNWNGQVSASSLSFKLARFEAVPPPFCAAVIQEGAEWQSLQHAVDIVDGGVFDRSAYLDAPAGKYGRVIPGQGGRLTFTAQPSRELRLWGVNLDFDAQYLSHQKADELADRLARAGYNTVRLHHYDRLLVQGRSSSWDLDPAQLDKFEYLFSAFKRNGIYVVMGLYSFRQFPLSELSDIGAGSSDEFMHLIPVSQTAFTLWKNYAQALLTHRNPYTQLTWAEDPGLLAIYMLNEESMFFGEWANRPMQLRSLYESRYASWLGAHTPLPDTDESFNRFLTELKIESDAAQMDYLRNTLHVQALLTSDNNMDTEAQVFIRDRFDVVDDHMYWAHPEFVGAFQWSLPIGTNHVSLLGPGGLWLPRRQNSSRILDKPFFVTEYNSVFPNSQRAEAGLVMGAYSALQAWNAIYAFDYSSSEAMQTAPTAFANGLFFSMVTDPISTLSDRAGAFIFLHGQVAPATSTVSHLAEKSRAFVGTRGHPVDVPEGTNWMGVSHRVGVLPEGPDLAARAVDAGVIAFTKGDTSGPSTMAGLPYLFSDWELETRLHAVDATRFPTRDDRGFYRSETGQIEMHRDRETMKLVTPMVEAFATPSNVALSGTRVTVENGWERSVIYVYSADTQPLAASSRVLVMHLTDSQDTGMVFASNDHTRLETEGHLPHVVKRGSATITLQLAGSGWRAWAVDSAGRRLRQVALTQSSTSGTWVLHAHTATDRGTALAYELQR